MNSAEGSDGGIRDFEPKGTVRLFLEGCGLPKDECDSLNMLSFLIRALKTKSTYVRCLSHSSLGFTVLSG